MTSTISGTLADQQTPSSIFRNLFPSGSITGAPKRRTMQIIRELETQPRGIYTGSIGYFAPGGEACFNVAIRTLALSGDRFTLGVGGGITLDSTPGGEYEECRLKGAFLTRTKPSFALLETMLCDGGIPGLVQHLRRLANSAEYFGIRYDAQALLQELLQTADSCGDTPARIRMTLEQSGKWQIATTPLTHPNWTGRLLLSDERTHSRDVFLHHKTTHRAFYDDHLRAAERLGFDEVLFRNEHDHLTEACISNLFLRLKGQWLTPALRSGVLPGVGRASLLTTMSSVRETEVMLSDLQQAEDIFLCNGLRGIRPVHRIEANDGSFIWQRNSS